MPSPDQSNDRQAREPLRVAARSNPRNGERQHASNRLCPSGFVIRDRLFRQRVKSAGPDISRSHSSESYPRNQSRNEARSSLLSLRTSRSNFSIAVIMWHLQDNSTTLARTYHSGQGRSTHMRTLLSIRVNTMRHVGFSDTSTIPPAPEPTVNPCNANILNRSKWY